MTPRMITIMVRVPESVSDEEFADAMRIAVDCGTPYPLDLDTLLVDCRSLPENEDKFFRRHSFWEKPE